MKESDFGFNSDQIVMFERAGFHDNKSTGLANDTRINVVYLDTHIKNVTLVNCAPVNAPVDTKSVSIPSEGGEPWYFNYDQESVKTADVNPPAASVRTKYDDPRRYSDMLP
jgi:hypothetical protein